MNVTTHCYGNTLAVKVTAATATEVPSRDLHIGFLIDNSGSMEGPRLDAVKRTLHAARGILSTGDRVTLITFSEAARVLLANHSLGGEGMDAFYAAVDNIRPDASTNLGAGIEALFGAAVRDYDVLILLTDGVVNAGITSTAGLRAMALGAAGSPAFNTLGYGADHNRALLRDIATRSRGTYTFVESDEILPIAMADILSGARAEVIRDMRLAAPAGWTCLEVGGERVGSVMPGRDYWVVYSRDEGAAGSVLYVTTGTEQIPFTLPEPQSGDIPPEVLEQLFRARVGAAMVALSDRLEGGGAPGVGDLDAIRREIEALPIVVRTRPLMLRLIGQIAEIQAAIPPMPAFTPSLRGGPLPVRTLARADVMARLASGATILCTQRGVHSMAGDEGMDPNHVSFFSTPYQRNASNTTHATYTGVPTARPSMDPDADAPSEPVMEEID
jgi:hypothetical protein